MPDLRDCASPSGPSTRTEGACHGIVQGLRSQSIAIYGDGSQTRSFCYVGDMVAALLALMNSADQVTGPINIGNPCAQQLLGWTPGCR